MSNIVRRSHVPVERHPDPVHVFRDIIHITHRSAGDNLKGPAAVMISKALLDLIAESPQSLADHPSIKRIMEILGAISYSHIGVMYGSPSRRWTGSAESLEVGRDLAVEMVGPAEELRSVVAHAVDRAHPRATETVRAEAAQAIASAVVVLMDSKAESITGARSLEVIQEQFRRLRESHRAERERAALLARAARDHARGLPRPRLEEWGL